MSLVHEDLGLYRGPLISSPQVIESPGVPRSALWSVAPFHSIPCLERTWAPPPRRNWGRFLFKLVVTKQRYGWGLEDLEEFQELLGNWGDRRCSACKQQERLLWALVFFLLSLHLAHSLFSVCSALSLTSLLLCRSQTTFPLYECPLDPLTNGHKHNTPMRSQSEVRDEGVSRAGFVLEALHKILPPLAPPLTSGGG